MPKYTIIDTLDRLPIIAEWDFATIVQKYNTMREAHQTEKFYISDRYIITPVIYSVRVTDNYGKLKSIFYTREESEVSKYYAENNKPKIKIDLFWQGNHGVYYHIRRLENHEYRKLFGIMYSL